MNMKRVFAAIFLAVCPVLAINAVQEDLKSDSLGYYYEYEIKFNDMTAPDLIYKFDNQFGLTVAEVSGIPVYRQLEAAEAQKNAFFVLSFDISAIKANGEQLYIKSVTLRDKLTAVSGTLGVKENSIIQSLWSTNAIDYTGFNLTQTPDIPQSQNNQVKTDTFSISQDITKLYYKVEFANSPADTDGFLAHSNLWNRQTLGGDDWFRIELRLGYIQSPPDTYEAGSGTEQDPYRIATLTQLDSLSKYCGDWDKHFMLANNIDMAAKGQYTTAFIAADSFSDDSVFDGVPFSGTFNGNGCTIRNFTINTLGNSDTSDNGNDFLGFFGQLEGAVVKDLNFANCLAAGGEGSNVIGILAAGVTSSNIDNCHAGGTAGSSQQIRICGGLMGFCLMSDIQDCGFEGNIIAGAESYYIGGLIGSIQSDCSVLRSYSDCVLSAAQSSTALGGFCGNSSYASIGYCFALCDITTEASCGIIGCFAGSASQSGIYDCYAEGNVDIGELSSKIGGFAGINLSQIARCYAVMTGGSWYNISQYGGFVGCDDSALAATDVIYTQCLWNSQTSGVYTPVADTDWNNATTDDPAPSGINGLSTYYMKQASSYTIAYDWDFVDLPTTGDDGIWGMIENQTYPKLFWECISHPSADINGDCMVNLADISALAAQWLDCGYVSSGKCN